MHALCGFSHLWWTHQQPATQTLAAPWKDVLPRAAEVESAGGFENDMATNLGESRFEVCYVEEWEFWD